MRQKFLLTSRILSLILLSYGMVSLCFGCSGHRVTPSSGVTALPSSCPMCDLDEWYEEALFRGEKGSKK